MPRNKPINITLTAPDNAPEGTRIELVRRDGAWVATVTTPINETTTLREVVQPAGLLNDAQRTRVENVIEHLYDAAMRGAGYS
jgi:hypothetical protein